MCLWFAICVVHAFMKHLAEHYIMRFPECFVGARVTVGLEVAYDRVAVLCKPCSGGQERLVLEASGMVL